MTAKREFIFGTAIFRIRLAMGSLGLCACAACIAAPEEIQVYLDEFAAPGKFGLDLHTNYVLSAQPGSNTRRMLRVTPELSYGFNENWEGALYWLTSVGPAQLDGHPVTDGVKIRAKWRPRAPTPDSPWYGAINVELGQLSRRFYPDQTSVEIKLIGVYQKGPLTLGANLNLDRALRTDAQQPATAELDTKAAYRITSKNEGDVRLGIENYAFLGALRSWAIPSTRTSSTFLVTDFSFRRWDFNVGLGKASGATPDRWLIKAVIGIPLD
ncbi:hypothetical protein [Polaromonas sp.]|uniref:hypothetical protein n=1 Tax=Polaromonas sp. TaxID=1869339 RepID=UPI003BAB4C0E